MVESKHGICIKSYTAAPKVVLRMDLHSLLVKTAQEAGFPLASTIDIDTVFNPTHQPQHECWGEKMSGRGLYPAPQSGGDPPRPEDRGLLLLDESNRLESDFNCSADISLDSL